MSTIRANNWETLNGLGSGKLEVESVDALDTLDLQAGVTISTKGYYTAGDGGQADYLIMDATVYGATPDGYGDHALSNGNVAVLQVSGAVNVRQFGAKGDGVADDSTAIQAAISYWKSSSTTLIFAGVESSFRLGSTVHVDFNYSEVGSLIVEGAIKPDAGIGNAMEFTDLTGGFFSLRVQGGGDTADYSLPDPAGGSQAFVFTNAYGTNIDYVEGKNYKGRVLRIRNGPDTSVNNSQWMKISKLYGDSTAPKTASEADRLAAGIGQLFYIDSAGPAFGVIESVSVLWDLYGPVVENTTDITIKYLETLFRGNTGFELRGVISFWGGKILVGSGLNTFPNMTIKRSASRQSYNINIDTLFTTNGSIGLEAIDIADDGDVGMVVNSIHSRLCTDIGVKLTGCKKFDLKVQSYLDNKAIVVNGDSFVGRINCIAHGAKTTAISVEDSASNINFTGYVSDGNTSITAGTSLVDIATTGNVTFNDFTAQSDNVDFLYDISSGNLAFVGGRVNPVGSAALVNGFPDKVSNVAGWVTEWSSNATILAGNTSVIVSHGLVKKPTKINVTGSSPQTQTLYVSGVTDTEFTITVPSAVTGDHIIYWEASVDYNY